MCHSAEFDEYGDAQLLHNAGNDVSEQNVVHLTGRYRTRTEDLSFVRVIVMSTFTQSANILIARRYCRMLLLDASVGRYCQ